MKLKKLLLPVIFSLFSYGVQGQVLISLLLGDKLNSDKLEFGIDGGMNLLNISNTASAKTLTNWNLGFYFDFKMKEKLFIHTGVIVKSRMGVANLTPYSLNNNQLDSLFTGGSVDRKLNYFNVPVMVRYRIIEYLHAEGGIQLGLRYKSFDYFKNGINNKEDLVFKNNISDNFTRIDAGAVLGLGYKLKKGKGMTLSARYYLGLVDVDKQASGNQQNRALYINVSIPVGRSKGLAKAEN